MSDIGMILERIGKTLVLEVSPKLEGDYAGGQAVMSGMMAAMAGQAWDGAVDRLLTEIEGMRALLGEGGVVIQTSPVSMKISDLESLRNTLAGELIALQTRLEDSEEQEAKALNTKIWGFLLATAAARMPAMPEFE